LLPEIEKILRQLFLPTRRGGRRRLRGGGFVFGAVVPGGIGTFFVEITAENNVKMGGR
jgi:hypothetical protein